MKKRMEYFEQKRNEEQGVVQKQRVLKQFERFLKGKELSEISPEDVASWIFDL